MVVSSCDVHVYSCCVVHIRAKTNVKRLSLWSACMGMEAGGGGDKALTGTFLNEKSELKSFLNDRGHVCIMIPSSTVSQILLKHAGFWLREMQEPIQIMPSKGAQDYTELK